MIVKENVQTVASREQHNLPRKCNCVDGVH